MISQNGNQQPTFFSQPEHQPFDLGKGSVGALLIHGFPGTPAEMRPLGERLAAHAMRARGILLPGFGPQIPLLGTVNRDRWMEAARHAWEEIRTQHETAVLIGFSMGGAIAMQLAAAAPPRALVLLAPFWRMGNWQFNLLGLLKYLRPSIAPFENVDFSNTAVRRQIKQFAPEADLDDPEVQQFFRDEVVLPTRVIDDVRRLTAAAYDIAPQVTTPTLVLQGQHDDVVTPKNTRRLLTQIGGPVTYREFDGDHTFTKIASPDSYDFTRDVLAFLKREDALPAKQEAWA